MCKKGHETTARRCKRCIAESSLRYWRKKHGVQSSAYHRRPSILGVVGHTPERRSYDSMISRCTNPAQKAWPQYGGRGITVCERWRISIHAFLRDVGPRPGPGYSLDRINTDGNYEPGNVRWATNHQQNRNKRNNVWVEFDGKRQCLADWSNELRITAPTLAYRLRNGTFPYGKFSRSATAALMKLSKRTAVKETT